MHPTVQFSRENGSRHIDSVKVEKSRAMMRYHQRRNIVRLLGVLEVLVALTLLSSSSIRLPTAVRLYGYYLLQLCVSLSKLGIVFLLGNAIVISLLLFFRQDEPRCIRGTGDLYDEYVQNSETSQLTSLVSYCETPASVAEETVRHLCDEYVQNCETSQRTLVSYSETPTPTTEETVWTDKPIVCLENAVSKTECDAVELAIRQATKEIKRFQRTRSEKLKHELRAKPGQEFRLSETEMRRSIIPGVTKRWILPLYTMDTLSSEEFRRTIDSYIAKHWEFIHQNFIRTGRMADESE